MQSQSNLNQGGLLEGAKQIFNNKWETLTDDQQSFLRKGWSVITYKWRWQIAMNIPYLSIFLLDRTIPAVHEFDVKLLATMMSFIPIPAFISSWLGLS